MNESSPEGESDRERREPRWQALIAIVAAGGLSVALAPGLSIGPPWLFPAIIGVLLGGTGPGAAGPQPAGAT